MTALGRAPRPKVSEGNGYHPAPVVKTETLTFEDLGYPGWEAEVRLNPTAEQWDKLLDAKGDDLWDEFSRVVIDWNFVDDSGNALPKPDNGQVFRKLPWDIRRELLNRYFRKFDAESDAPKDSSDNSTSTSTNGQ